MQNKLNVEQEVAAYSGTALKLNMLHFDSYLGVLYQPESVTALCSTIINLLLVVIAYLYNLDYNA